MNINNYLTSVIRTWVPIGIGVAIAWLSARSGFVLDESSQVGLTAGATGAAIGLYYAIVRKIEVTFPQLGWLLGLAKAPGYAVAGAPPAQPSPGTNPDSGDAGAAEVG